MPSKEAVFKLLIDVTNYLKGIQDSTKETEDLSSETKVLAKGLEDLGKTTQDLAQIRKAASTEAANAKSLEQQAIAAEKANNQALAEQLRAQAKEASAASKQAKQEASILAQTQADQLGSLKLLLQADKDRQKALEEKATAAKKAAKEEEEAANKAAQLAKTTATEEAKAEAAANQRAAKQGEQNQKLINNFALEQNAINKLYEAQQRFLDLEETGSKKQIADQTAIVNALAKSAAALGTLTAKQAELNRAREAATKAITSNSSDPETIKAQNKIKLIDQEIASIQKEINARQVQSEKEIAEIDKVRAKEDKANKDSLAATELKNQRIIDGIQKLVSGFKDSVQSLLTGQGDPFAGLQASLTAIGEIGGPVGSALAAVANAGIGAVSSFKQLVDSTVESQKQLGILQDTTGLTAKTIKELEIAAKQMGLGFTQVIGAADHFAETIAKAKDEDEAAIDRLRRLGITVKDLDKPLDDLFRGAAKTFASIPPGAEKAALGFETFQLRGQKVIDNFGKNLDSLDRAVKDSFAVIDDAGVNSLKGFSDASLSLETALDGVRNLLAVELAPVFEKLAIQAKNAFNEIKADPNIVEGLKTLVKAGETLIATFGTILIDAIKTIVTNFGLLGEEIHAINEQIGKFIPGFDLVGDTLAATTLPLKVVIGAFQSLLDVTESIGDSLGLTSFSKQAANAAKAQEKLAIENANTAKAHGEAERAAQKHADSLKTLEKQIKDTSAADQAATDALEQNTKERLSRVKAEETAKNISRLQGATQELNIIKENSAQIIATAERKLDNLLKLRNKELELGKSTAETETKIEEAKLGFRKTLQEQADKITEAAQKKEKAALDEQLANIKLKETAAETEATKAREKVQDELDKGIKNNQQAAEAIEKINQDLFKKKIADLVEFSLKNKLSTEDEAKNDQKIADLKKAQAADVAAFNKNLNKDKIADDKAALDALSTAFAAQSLERKTTLQNETNLLAQRVAIQGDSIDKEKLLIDQGKLRVRQLADEAIDAQNLVTLAQARLRELQNNGKQDELNNQRIKQAIAEISSLQAAADTKHIAAINEAKNLQQQSIDQTIAGIQASADALSVTNQKLSNDATDAISALAGKATAFQTTFDATNAKIEQVREHIKDLYHDAQSLSLFPGAYIAQVQSFYDAAEALQNKLNQSIAQAAQAEALKNAEARFKAEQAANVQILNDLKKEQEEEAKAQQAHNEDTKKRLEDIQKTKDDIATAEKNKAEDNQKALDKIDEEEAQKQKDRAIALAEAKFKAVQDSNARIAALNKESRLNELNAEDDFSSAQADIRAQIRAKQAELAKNPSNKAALDAEIKALEEKLKSGSEQEEARKKAVEKRDQEIADAKLQLDKELGAATNQAEKDAAQKRFDNKSQAANDELSVELDYQKRKAKAIADGDKQELAEVEANHIKKLAAVQDAATKQNQIIDSTLAHDKQVLADQAAAEKAAYDQKVADQKKRGEDELQALKDADKAKLQQQIDDLAASNKAFKDAEEARKTALAEQIASITNNLGLASDQIAGYIGKLAASLGIAADKIKPIADAIAKITDATKATNDAATAAAGGSPSSGQSGNSVLGGSTPTPGSSNTPPSSSDSGSPIVISAGLTKQPPKNADSGQGAGAGTSKTNGQQPGSTGIPSPSTTSPGSVEALIAALTKLYQDFKGAATSDKADAINKTVVDLITATAQNLKLKIVNGALVLKDGTLVSIAGSMAARISPAIYNQRKGLFNKGIEDLTANFNDAIQDDSKTPDPGSGDTAGGKLAKGGDINTPGGVGKGQGGGDLNTGVTSKIIKGAQANPRTKGEDRSGLETADREATKGAGQGIDNVSVGFSGDAFGDVGKKGAESRGATPTTTSNPSSNNFANTTQLAKQDVKVQANLSAPITVVVQDMGAVNQAIKQALQALARDADFANDLEQTRQQSTRLSSRG